MFAPRCAHCGDPFELRRADDRYCPACERRLSERYAPKPAPEFVPVWMREVRAKSLNGLPA